MNILSTLPCSTPVARRRRRPTGFRRAGRDPFGLACGLTVLAVILGAFLVSTGTLRAQDPPPRAIQATTEIPEELLLDVGIHPLEDGVPNVGKEDWEWEEEGIFPDLRRAEARYIPVRLMRILQATGHWGAVRVVPRSVEAMDLLVSGRIEESTGMDLVLRLWVRDASGDVWFQRKYKAEADPRAYRGEEGDSLVEHPFQEVYVEFANDLLHARQKRDAEEIARLRTLSRLRFAAELVPDAFDEHLEQNRKGRYEVVSLPAEGDPLMARIQQVRYRDELFIDTVSEHYATFKLRMEPAYDSWRQFSYEELAAARKIKKKARKRKILGTVGILAGVLAGADNRAQAAAREAALYAGIYGVVSGIYQGKEAKIHTEALRELAASLDAEMEPLLMEVEGQTLVLEGSMETQFGTWRDLLGRIFREETGLEMDPNTGEPVGTATLHTGDHPLSLGGPGELGKSSSDEGGKQTQNSDTGKNSSSEVERGSAAPPAVAPGTVEETTSGDSEQQDDSSGEKGAEKEPAEETAEMDASSEDDSEDAEEEPR